MTMRLTSKRQSLAVGNFLLMLLDRPTEAREAVMQQYPALEWTSYENRLYGWHLLHGLSLIAEVTECPAVRVRAPHWFLEEIHEEAFAGYSSKTHKVAEYALAERIRLGQTTTGCQPAVWHPSPQRSWVTTRKRAPYEEDRQPGAVIAEVAESLFPNLEWRYDTEEDWHEAHGWHPEHGLTLRVYPRYGNVVVSRLPCDEVEYGLKLFRDKSPWQIASWTIVDKLNATVTNTQLTLAHAEIKRAATQHPGEQP